MSAVRASDRQRERTVRALHDACADGRLSASTLEARVECAFAARTVGELRQLTVDLERVSHALARVGHAVTRRRRRPALGEASLWLAGIGAQPFIVGRGRGADLALPDDTVSRRHAQIVRTGDGFMLADLGSTNGTWMDGRRVGQVEVAPGDVVELGNAALHLL
jgi:hypothetical protein